MLPTEARMIFGFDTNQKLTSDAVRSQYSAMIRLNDVHEGGSEFLNEKFLVAAHILVRSEL